MSYARQRRRGGLTARIPTSDSPTLEDAYHEAIGVKWADLRSVRMRSSQLKLALHTLCGLLKGDTTTITVAQIRRDHVAQCVAHWRVDLAPGTINHRLSLLSAIGVDTSGLWVKNKLPLKWWLTPDDCTRLLAYLRGGLFEPFLHARLLADYVELVSLTGLRVEEALRLKWGEVTIRIRPTIDGKVVSRSEITIPGTKTRGAQATIAIALLPALLLRRMSEETSAGPHEAVFPISYRSLERTWEFARLFLGVQENHMATLKALRRTAARHLTVNGMPTEMVRAYLRHSNIQTTMGYLSLVGGYSTEEQHRWLD